MKGGILSRDDANQVLQSVLASPLPALGVHMVGHIESPILGGAGKGKAGMWSIWHVGAGVEKKYRMEDVQ